MSAPLPTPSAQPAEGDDNGPLAPALAAQACGDWAQASSLAQPLWEAAGHPPTRARAGLLACRALFRQGELPALLQLAPDVMAELHAQRQWPGLFELQRLQVLSASELGEHELAMRQADLLLQRVRELGTPADLVMALNAMAACHERMGDPWQAERLMVQALELAREVGDAVSLMSTLNNHCAVCTGAYYLLRDEVDPPAAAQALQRAVASAREAVALAAQVGGPFQRVLIEGNLGEVLLHQGGRNEAYPLLHRALEAAQQQGMQVQVARIRCSLAEGALRDGQPEQVLVWLGAGLPPLEGMTLDTRIRLHHALYAAQLALGQTGQALHHLARGSALQRNRLVRQLRAHSDTLVTRTEAEQARQAMEAERHRASELAERVTQDPLTGLGNRRLLVDALPRLLAQARRREAPLSVAVVDVDHFKRINDGHGHPLGDQVLVTLAQLLKEQVRAADLPVRLGGEEFMVLLPDTPLALALEVAERWRQRIEAHDWAQLQPGLAVTVSIGLCQTPPHEAAALYERADRALYRAKQAGRNRVCVEDGGP